MLRLALLLLGFAACGAHADYFTCVQVEQKSELPLPQKISTSFNDGCTTMTVANSEIKTLMNSVYNTEGPVQGMTMFFRGADEEATIVIVSKQGFMMSIHNLARSWSATYDCALVNPIEI